MIIVAVVGHVWLYYFIVYHRHMYFCYFRAFRAQTGLRNLFSHVPFIVAYDSINQCEPTSASARRNQAIPLFGRVVVLCRVASRKPPCCLF